MMNIRRPFKAPVIPGTRGVCRLEHEPPLDQVVGEIAYGVLDR